jgi:hypothetical protein
MAWPFRGFFLAAIRVAAGRREWAMTHLTTTMTGYDLRASLRGVGSRRFRD